MWQEAKANDKRIRELMADHRKRAERRRAYYESKLGDPQQLIRVIGSSSKLYPDAEQFYYHENPDNLMPWQGNPDIKIDRFDGRSLLDYIPDSTKNSYQDFSKDDKEISDELNFERYHDLIEAERLNVSETERLAEVEEEWTKLLDRHQAKLALLKNQERTHSKNHTFGYDYGTGKVNNEDLYQDNHDEKASRLLKEVDILQYVDDLTDKDKQILNEMSGKYGIRSYARLLRLAKKDRDDELRSLKRQQEEGKPKDGLSKSERRKRRRRRRRRHRRRRSRSREDNDHSYRRRHSPTYEPYYNQDDESGSSYSSWDDSDDDDDDSNHSDSSSDNAIEFGSTSTPEEHIMDRPQKEEEEIKKNKSVEVLKSVPTIERKLTPMEKLKLKMREGLEKQIVSDERDRRRKEREKEIEQLQELAKSQGLPIDAYLRPEPPTRERIEKEEEKEDRKRYYSPSSSDNEEEEKKLNNDKKGYDSSSSNEMKESRKRYHSPSSSSEKGTEEDSTKNKRRYRSPSTSRSRSRDNDGKNKRERYRSPSTDSDDNRRKERKRDVSYKRYTSPSTSNRKYTSSRNSSRSYSSRNHSSRKESDYRRYKQRSRSPSPPRKSRHSSYSRYRSPSF